MRFRDRRDAGRQLAARLVELAVEDPLVLALPRGGVVVGFEVARALRAPLDVFVARKVGAPGHVEYGIGAVAEGGVALMNETAVRALNLSSAGFAALAEREQRELTRRVEVYRGGRPLPPITDRTVILVDDGIATGVTAEAALRGLLALSPGRLSLAVPVCAPPTVDRMSQFADDIVFLHAPAILHAVGAWYVDFREVTDHDVLDLLERARAARSRK